MQTLQCSLLCERITHVTDFERFAGSAHITTILLFAKSTSPMRCGSTSKECLEGIYSDRKTYTDLIHNHIGTSVLDDHVDVNRERERESNQVVSPRAMPMVEYTSQVLSQSRSVPSTSILLCMSGGDSTGRPGVRDAD
jgi:hypothetical protein